MKGNKKFISLKTDWQNATKLEGDGVGEIKKLKVITTPLGSKARVFIERDSAVPSQRLAGDNQTIFGGDQTKQVKNNW